MVKLQLYYDGISQPCRAVYLFIKANNIDFDLKKINFFKGDTDSAEFLAVNPYGAVPCLVDDDFVLRESVAIMLYLSDKYPNVPDHWYPKDVKQRARINMCLHWYPNSLRIQGSNTFREKALMPFLTGKPFDVKAYESHVETLEGGLKKLEELYIKENGYIFSDEISIADLLVVSELIQPIAGQYDMDTKHPKIAKYIERVRKRMQPHFEEIFRRIFFIKDRVAQGATGLDVLPTDPNII